MLKAAIGQRRAVRIGQGKPFTILSNGAKYDDSYLRRELEKKRRITDPQSCHLLEAHKILHLIH